MSDLQPPPPPPPPPPGGNPANPPGPNWTPASLSASGQASYAGKTSAPEPASTTAVGAPAINKFSPKRSLVPVLVTLLTIAVAAAVMYTALNPPKLPAATTSPSPTASQAPARPGTPFAVAYSDTSGVWQITKHRWTDRGLDAFIEVTVDNGAMDCTFNALSNSGQEVEKGLLSELTPQFDYTTISAGETRSGWVYFPMYERGTTLVFLRTLDQPQVSGIEISG